MSGDIFECCNWYWVEARDAGNTSTMDRIISLPTTKQRTNHLVQNGINVKVEKA